MGIIFPITTIVIVIIIVINSIFNTSAIIVMPQWFDLGPAQDIGDNYSSHIQCACHMTSYVDGLIQKS